MKVLYMVYVTLLHLGFWGRVATLIFSTYITEVFFCLNRRFYPLSEHKRDSFDLTEANSHPPEIVLFFSCATRAGNFRIGCATPAVLSSCSSAVRDVVYSHQPLYMRQPAGRCPFVCFRMGYTRNPVYPPCQLYRHFSLAVFLVAFGCAPLSVRHLQHVQAETVHHAGWSAGLSRLGAREERRAFATLHGSDGPSHGDM